MGLLKLKGLVWDFWNLNDHFGKNEKLKGPLDAFDLFLLIWQVELISTVKVWIIIALLNDIGWVS